MTPGTVGDPLSDAMMQPFTERNASSARRTSSSICSLRSLVLSFSARYCEADSARRASRRPPSLLTRTGQICDEKRQEFILLSDVLGVSMLVDAVNHRRPSGDGIHRVGPFHVPDAPALPMGANIRRTLAGNRCWCAGRSATRTEGRSVARFSMSGRPQPTGFTTFRTSSDTDELAAPGPPRTAGSGSERSNRRRIRFRPTVPLAKSWPRWVDRRCAPRTFISSSGRPATRA
jgi:hypothetical protein